MSNNQLAVTVVSLTTGIPESTILSPSRKWPAVEARMLIILLLSYDGATDESTATLLNRSRISTLKSRHNAMNMMEMSRAFRAKFNRIKQLYDEQKSIRIS